MIEAIILAGGESRRMGRLKPLIKIDNKTALAVIVDMLREAGISVIHVVVGYKAEKIVANAGVSAHFVRNADYKKGQFSSLQCGIRAVGSECSGALVCLVDQPHIQVDWVLRLIEEKNRGDAWIIRPHHCGKRGHPLIIGKELFPEILEMPATLTAKELMRRYAQRTAFVEIGSDGILYDADTPDELDYIQRYLNEKAPDVFPPGA